ncbi:MAG TPA: hypothetical protein PKK12_02515, partial [Candidatus Aminicenantes bacterium]|nr:hypothetical protein [Candidatus Aminicenantes bacterium]
VFNSIGNKIMVQRSIKPRPLLKKDKEDIFSFWEKTPPYSNDIKRYKERAVFSKNYPAIYYCCIDSGRIYLFTYSSLNEPNECYIYRSNGEFIKSLMINIYKNSCFEKPILAIRNNTVFQLIWDNDAENWCLIESTENLND